MTNISGGAWNRDRAKPSAGRSRTQTAALGPASAPWASLPGTAGGSRGLGSRTAAGGRDFPADGPRRAATAESTMTCSWKRTLEPARTPPAAPQLRAGLCAGRGDAPVCGGGPDQDPRLRAFGKGTHFLTDLEAGSPRSGVGRTSCLACGCPPSPLVAPLCVCESPCPLPIQTPVVGDQAPSPHNLI